MTVPLVDDGDMRPLRFVVCRIEDGTILASYSEDELATYGTGKTWHEAACWAHIAVVADRLRQLSLLAETS